MPLRILAVDDEEHIGRAVRRALFGYDVTTVSSGAAALERIHSDERFDAIVCDVHMPEMDGHELALRVAAVAPDLADKILFLTGDDAAFETLSGRAVLLKPFETHLLRSRLEQLVKPTGVRKRYEVTVTEAETAPEPRVSQRPTARPPKAGGEEG